MVEPGRDMKFDDLEAKMRPYETASDRCVPPGMFMVARVDGRGFTRLTRARGDLEVPFDPQVRDVMIATTDHLMNCGFHVTYGYAQSDEISLLFRMDEATFGRKLRKLISVLAGEASAKFTLLLGELACFDCRISELPNADLVVEYFRWRQEDAARNALSAHAFWALRKSGESASAAAGKLGGMGLADKHELLHAFGVNFNDLPTWQRRGTGLYWERYEKDAVNPRTGEVVQALRRRMKVDFELPMKDEYAVFVRQMAVRALDAD